jgi:hypothetical protein
MFSLFFSVSNFYFTSQYHQFPLSHPAAAAAFSSHTLSNSSSHISQSSSSLRRAVEIPPKARYKQKQNTL